MTKDPKPTVDQMIARLPPDRQAAVLAKAEKITQARTAASIMHDDRKIMRKLADIPLDKLMASVLTPAEQDMVHARAAQINLQRDAVHRRWLHEPAMKEKLACADEWMRQNPPQETILDELEAKLCPMAPVGKEILD